MLLNRKNPVKRDFRLPIVRPGHFFEFSLPWKSEYLPADEFGIFLDYDEARKELKIHPRVLMNREEMSSERYPIDLARNGNVLVNGYLLKPVPTPMGGRDDEYLGPAGARDENLGTIRRGRPDNQKPIKKKGG